MDNYTYFKLLSKIVCFFPMKLLCQENKFHNLKYSHHPPGTSEKLFSFDKLEMPPWTAGFILVTFHLHS